MPAETGGEELAGAERQCEFETATPIDGTKARFSTPIAPSRMIGLRAAVSSFDRAGAPKAFANARRIVNHG